MTRFPAAIAVKEFVDNIALITEVVIEITRTDTEFGSNMISGDITLAILIKQLEANVKNAVSCFHLGNSRFVIPVA